MDTEVRNFIEKKNIAVIGLSKKKNKFGNAAFKELKSRGYNVHAVHPGETEIDGIPCSPNIASIKDKVESVFISVSPIHIPAMLQEISSAGIKHVWLQQGCESPEAINEAQKLNLSLVTKKCILMYAEPVKSIHKFHRVIADFFRLN